MNTLMTSSLPTISATPRPRALASGVAMPGAAANTWAPVSAPVPAAVYAPVSLLTSAAEAAAHNFIQSPLHATRVGTAAVAGYAGGTGRKQGRPPRGTPR